MISAMDFASLQDAIDEASSGDGSVLLAPGVTQFSETLIARSGVSLKNGGQSILQWVGVGGTAISSDRLDILEGFAIRGGVVLDAGLADKGIELNSPVRCALHGLKILSANQAQICIDIQCNESGAVNAWGNRNAAFNDFNHVHQDGLCGTVFRLQGDGTAQGDAPVNGVTLNSFHAISGAGVARRGIDFVKWCDSNVFSGMTYFRLLGDNAVGIEFNTQNPLTNCGVYANTFQHVAVDTFLGYTGRVGLKLNWCDEIVIGLFFQDPEAEGGAIVISDMASSYNIRHAKGGSTYLYELSRQSPLRGARSTLTSDGPAVKIEQEWNNAAVAFHAKTIDIIDTASGPGSEFAHYTRNGIPQYVCDAVGNTIQRGSAVLGVGATTEPAGVTVGHGRAGSGPSFVDLIGDVTYPGYGGRLIRWGGPNSPTQLLHRGSGDLQLQAQDANGRITLTDFQGVARVSANKNGVGFNGSAPSRPTVSGGVMKDQALRSALAQIGLIITY